MLDGEIKNLNFKEASSELEKIVKELENPNITLEKSTELFERGVELSKICYDKLEHTRGKITMLSKELEGLTEKPFVLPNSSDIE